MPNMGGAAAIFKQSSDPASSAVAGDLWSDTDNETLKRRNDANDGWITLNSSELADVSAETTVPKISSTIGDYTTPDSATASSFASDAVYSTDFSSDSGWTLTANGGTVAIASNKLTITANSNADHPTATYDLYAALGDSVLADTWVLRYKVSFADLDNNASGQGVKWDGGCISGTSLSPQGNPTNVDSFVCGLHLHAASSNGNWMIQNYNDPRTDVTGSSFSLPYSGTFWIEVTRTSASAGTVKRYTNANYSGTPAETLSVSFNSNPASLRYLFFRWNYDNVTDSNTVNFEDVEIFNNTTSATEYPASNAVDNDTATYWQSNSETNPNIYVDVGSVLNIGQVTIYPKNTTTETELKIQTSSNASSWTDVRKITYSNLTEGAYNYIRFNIKNARYVRIYGNNGSAKILAINEIKCQELTDGAAADDHGHYPISATSTSIALNGT